MKATKFLFSPVCMGVIFVVLAIAMALATFIENGNGASTARALIYNSHWFELLFLLLAVNLTGQIISYKLYRHEKMTVMLFHLAFIIMIAGTAITRYTGYDGIMHIREGESTALTYSSDQYLIFDIVGENGEILAHHSKPFSLTPVTNDKYSKTVSKDGSKIKLRFKGYNRNVTRTIEENADGKPLVSLMVTRDMVTSETLIVPEGESAIADDLEVGFSVDADVRVTLSDSLFYISSSSGMNTTRMSDMEVAAVAPDTLTLLERGIVYSSGDYKLVLLNKTGKGVVITRPAREREEGTGALEFSLSVDGVEKDVYLMNNLQNEDSYWTGMAGDFIVKITYGSRIDSLPFSLKLNDFILERYPGSDSPSGFISNVILSDKKHNTEIQHDIYMNHILRYNGYRFYQSSYDKDEKGTILSVNHDRAGMLTTYSGYALLFLFIILSLLNRKSFFRTVSTGYWNSRLRKAGVVFLLLSATTTGSSLKAQKLIPGRSEAEAFGEVLTQDNRGRTKPLYTISSDFLRKVSRENNLDGLSSMQVFLGYSLDFAHWQNEPLIKISNDELRKLLLVKGEKAAFSELVDLKPGGEYKLAGLVEEAYSKPANERNRFDKEVIRLDERVNICYMVARGDFLKIFPLRDGTDHWGTAEAAAGIAADSSDAEFVRSVLPLWAQAAAEGQSTGKGTEEYRSKIIRYQRENSSYDLPSEKRIKAESFYYKAGIFEKLFPFYLSLGLVMIIALVAGIISGKTGRSLFLKILALLAVAGFILHTAGLGIRWYISGHSPMSNGYETMLFISWVTLLAGIIFSRRSLMAFSATCVLGGLTLMVAHMSFMDPEITNLVPVLKSYWLTLHVSVITGSYGFLGLGAILGLIVLIMMLFANESNRERISNTIDELTLINYKTLTLGLYFLTIGTFLGAIWANESWGRYWGWDPKETWSLITIIVYTLVTHSRMMPGMKDVYTFNLLSLAAISSVLMTYFGVNYYLSGMHSYAGGEHAGLPVALFIVIGVLAILSMGSYHRYRKM